MAAIENGVNVNEENQALNGTGTSAILRPALKGGAIRLLERLIALGIAMLLLRSSFAHLGNPYFFLSTVYAYQLVGIDLGRLVAMVLPFLQMTTAVFLLCRWWAFEAYVASTLMFSAFVLVQMIVMSRGLDIPCGCFGSSNIKVGFESLIIAVTSTCASVIGGGCRWAIDQMGKKT